MEVTKVHIKLIQVILFCSAEILMAAPKVLVIHCQGGWDQTVVFDGKSGSSIIDTEDGAELVTSKSGVSYIKHASRPSVDEFFEAQGEQTLILNGLSTQGMGHQDAVWNSNSFMLPGKGIRVGWWEFYSGQFGALLDFPHVSLQAPYIPSSYEGTSIFLSDQSIQDFSKGYFEQGDSWGKLEDDLLLKYMQNNYPKLLDDNIAGSHDEQKKQALYLNATLEKPLKDFLNSQNFENSDNLLLNRSKIAIDFLAAEKSIVVEVADGAVDRWDTHYNNYAEQSILFEDLFNNLNQIISYANERGIGDDLIIIVKSELGRAPWLNSNKGKDHWPYTSMLLWGKNIKGATVVGKTNDFLIGEKVSAVFGSSTGFGDISLNYQNVAQAILQFNGVLENLLDNRIEPAFVVLKQD